MNRSKGPIIYPKWPLLILAPIVAFVALAYVERFSVKLALVTPQFYVAWLASTIIICVLMYVVHWVTTRFDAHYPWRQALERRLRKQLLAGIILPVLIAITLASIYFWSNSANIFDTIWFDKYFLLVVILLTIVNLAFALYGSVNEKTTDAATGQLAQITDALVFKDVTSEFRQDDVLVETETLPLGTSDTKFVDPDLLNIACVFCCNKHCYCIDMNGEDVIWPHSFGDSKKLLPQDYFFAINRSYLINFKAIIDHHSKSTKILVIYPLPVVGKKIIYTIEKALSSNLSAENQNESPVALLAKSNEKTFSKPLELRVSYGKKADFYAAEKKFKSLNSSANNKTST
ncbi:hypothetical protein [Pedobacter namyangjuensis]|uniref:hypothetical protein n=1 Tax=Pedobacter namyangjuensis TaxID=600626 RepID=UPI0013B3C9F6|nr:hypothetical protein [Pedobacter namyangjuensis]